MATSYSLETSRTERLHRIKEIIEELDVLLIEMQLELTQDLRELLNGRYASLLNKLF